MNTTAALWAAVVALGVYHGANPAMGWPLAVASGLTEGRPRALFTTWLALGAGHLAAMAIALLPFAWLVGYLSWRRELQLGAATLLMVFGAYRLVQRRHPRSLARIRPTRLAWWSLLVATAHGAGLMLVPFMFGLCEQRPDAGPIEAAHASIDNVLVRSTLDVALAVAAVHTLAMMAAGLALAWTFYRYLGLRHLRRAWFNLDIVWAASLVLAGAAGIASAGIAG